jgi:hypothetical protein
MHFSSFGLVFLESVAFVLAMTPKQEQKTKLTVRLTAI